MHKTKFRFKFIPPIQRVKMIARRNSLYNPSYEFANHIYHDEASIHAALQTIYEDPNDTSDNGEINRIRSVSTANYVDFRGTIDTAIQVLVTDGDHRSNDGAQDYFDWEFIELSDGTYNIKSTSSNMYLDGRDKRMGNGPGVVRVKLHQITSSAASQIDFFKWRLKEYSYGGKTRHALQNVSSGLYLDGRNPERVGAQLRLISDGNPEGNEHLLWDLLEQTRR